MKQKILLTLSLGIMLIFSACDKLDNLPEINFLKFNTDQCHSTVIEGRFIINNQEQYTEIMSQFLEDTLDVPSCTDATLPNIDFGTYTLLGYRVCGSGCETTFKREVYLDEVNMKYVYRVLVKEVGGCEPYRCDMNWILVPQLPKDYIVEFI